MTVGLERRVRVRYFAILREQRGVTEEELTTAASTPAELFQHLARQYRFTLGLDRVKAVVNDEFREWDIPIQDGDTIVFIPPVAGG